MLFGLVVLSFEGIIFEFISETFKINNMNYHDYNSCIDACLQFAAICNHCASMDLQEKDVAMMSRCAQLDMECAAICTAAAQMMSLGSDSAKDICKLCADICKKCGDECEKHDNEHCKECADACKKCEQACRAM